MTQRRFVGTHRACYVHRRVLCTEVPAVQLVQVQRLHRALEACHFLMRSCVHLQFNFSDPSFRTYCISPEMCISSGFVKASGERGRVNKDEHS